MDETSIPRSHLEMERLVIMQGGLSKMYNQYLLPKRKRAWAGGNDEKFMQDNSLYVAKLSMLKLYFVMLKNVKESVWKNLLSTVANAKGQWSKDMDVSDSDYCYYTSGSGSK